MSTWNKVLIGLIFVASIAFFILGARALKTHQYWRTQAAEYEEALATELESYDDLREQVRQLRLKLHEQLVDRGRVWYGCRPQPSPDTKTTGAVVVAVEFPDPHQITPNSVLWAFDELPVENGGRYLGQFAVAGVGGQANTEVQLQPSTRMIQGELDRLAQSAGRNGATWALYEIMPIDNHRSLAELSEDELKAMLPQVPPEIVEEYVSDGQLMTPEEMKQRGLAGNVYRIDANEEIVKSDGVPQEVEAENEKGKYVRQLRDYEESFRQHGLERTALKDKDATTQRNIKYITSAKEDAERQQVYRQKEHDRLVTELAEAKRERDLVAAHLKAVQGALAGLQAAVQETIKKNQSLAGEIARIQREATRIIDERTRAMAQAGAGN
jgi:hypothetical protein